MSNDHERLQWLALGMALASRLLLARIAGELDRHCFEPGKARELWLALGGGRDDVRGQLARLGVSVAADQQAPDAVLDAVRRLGAKERQRWAADRLQSAASLLSPEAFEAELIRITEEALGKQQKAVAGKVTPAAG